MNEEDTSYFRISNMKKAITEIDKKPRPRIRVINLEAMEGIKETDQIACSTGDSRVRGERINFLLERLSVHPTIESLFKEQSQTKD